MSQPVNQLNIYSLNDIDNVLLNVTKLSLEFLVIEIPSTFLLMIITKKRNLQHLVISRNNCVSAYAAFIKLLESQQCLKMLEIPVLWWAFKNINSFP